ncbi:uncharacterized protein E0L32_005130 [Thyridium curvatum]|uniref:NB-ARC domain-containing protein n=1 Tax=Thyridium curvatum TaxID=1093900 RepID=A0A507AVB3_9PEZI|nr:uncharacterized protein E0L32_005130 [Thyridium curvatum]TPX14735.1 hypothetical protein E0L32_005130 [Thyridium curvatum]
MSHESTKVVSMVRLLDSARYWWNGSGSENEDSHDNDSPDDWGFKVIANPDDATIDIVAIHGLNGHRDKSWTAPNGVNWLKDFLPGSFPKARILTYGYDARTHASTALSSSTLNTIGQHFLSEFCLFRADIDNCTTRRPVIFLAHSLGGLVLKSALLQSENRNRLHLYFQKDMKLSTYGIVFFGTPHSGGEGVTLAQIGLQIMSVYQTVNDKVIQHLEPQSEWLRDQVENFKKISPDFHIIFCYEDVKTPVIGGKTMMIVPFWSAVVSGVVNVESLAIRKNHHTMVKFGDANDNDLKNIKVHLRIMEQQASAKIRENWDKENRGSSPASRSSSQTRKHSLEQWLDDLRKTPIVDIPRSLPLATNMFVGRVEILSRIRKALNNTGRQVVVLHGTAGSGKTELALKYAEHYSKDFKSIFWVTASTATLLQQSFGAIAQAIVRAYAATIPAPPPPYGKIAEMIGLKGIVDGDGILQEQSGNADIICRAVRKWLDHPSNGPWLLIFDNYDQPEAFPIRESFPSNSRGKILVTTRRRDLASLGRGIEVESCNADDALQIFQNSCQRHSGFADSEIDLARQILGKLGNSPLAIDHAGSYIFTEQVSLQFYLDAFERQVRKLFEKKPPGYVSEYQHSVFSSFNLSFEAIEESAPEAARSLLFCSFYDASDIPLEVLRKSGGSNGENLTTTLFSHSLIKRTSDDAIDIHPLIHMWCREKLTKSEKGNYAAQAFQNIMTIIPISSNGWSRSKEDWAMERKAMPHVERAKAFVMEFCVPLGGRPELHRSLRDLGMIYQTHGKYKQAEELYTSVLEAQEMSTHDKFETALTKDGLARAKSMQDRNEEAAELFQQARPDILNRLGAQSLEYLLLLSGLGTVRQDQGHLEEAAELYKSALEGLRQIQGVTGVEFAGVAAFLSQVYKLQGRLGEAEDLSRQSVQGMLSRYGPTHPATMKWKQNLAIVLEEAGKLAEARSLLQEVLEFRRDTLGETHPSTLRTWYNLACTYFVEEDFEEAEAYCITCLAGRKKAYDKDHPMILRSMEQLGSIMFKTGRLEEAKKELEYVRDKFLNVHKATPLPFYSSMEWLAQVYEHTQPRRAASLFEEVCDGFGSILGPDHPKTQAAKSALASLRARQPEDEGFVEDANIEQ